MKFIVTFVTIVVVAQAGAAWFGLKHADAKEMTKAVEYYCKVMKDSNQRRCIAQTTWAMNHSEAVKGVVVSKYSKVKYLHIVSVNN